MKYLVFEKVEVNVDIPVDMYIEGSYLRCDTRNTDIVTYSDVFIFRNHDEVISKYKDRYHTSGSDDLVTHNVSLIARFLENEDEDEIIIHENYGGEVLIYKVIKL